MNRNVLIGWQMLSVLVLAILAATGASANSGTVSYQGVLRDAAQAPVADATYPMRFSIWDAATDGAKRWGDEDQSVTTRNGLFSVNLGSGVPLGTVFADYAALWLQIEVNLGPGLEVYNPRVPLASVPYAQKALNALNGSLIGEIICVYIGLPGVPSVADYQSKGWALCNGTTPAAQGIVGSPITAALPDLNGQSLFLRGTTPTNPTVPPGTIQGGSVGAHTHPANFTGNDTSTVANHTHSFGATTSNHAGHRHTQVVTANPGQGSAGRIDFTAEGTNTGTYAQGAYTDAAGAHTHTVSGDTGAGGGHYHTVSGTVTVQNNTGTTETRPVNMSVVYFMKVR